MHLILGTAGLSRSYGVLDRRLDAADSGRWNEALRKLGDAGFSAVDTAPIYGTAELTIGEAKPLLSIHTKLRPDSEPVESVRHSLARLGREKVEILYFHERFLGDKSQALAISKLNEFRGLYFEELGVSIYDEPEFESALHNPDINVIQVPFSVLDRRFDDQKVAAARSAGKVVIARSVFLQGMLVSGLERLPHKLGVLRPSIDQFIRICEVWNTSPLAAAMAFVKSRQDLHGMIVGAREPWEIPGLARGFKTVVERGLLEDLRSLVFPSWPATDPRTWEAR